MVSVSVSDEHAVYEPRERSNLQRLPVYWCRDPAGFWVKLQPQEPDLTQESRRGGRCVSFHQQRNEDLPEQFPETLSLITAECAREEEPAS